MKKISIVLPCKNEEDNLSVLTPELIKQIPTKYRWEIICVDDGSVDDTFSVTKKLGFNNKRIKGIILSKNFRQQAALMAGIKMASGDAIITMDADFQHPHLLEYFSI